VTEHPSDPLFRAEAVQWARGTRPGDPARLDARRTRVLFHLLLVLVGLAALAVAVVPVPTTVTGGAVLDPARGQVVATVPSGGDIAVGDPVTVTVGQSETFDSSVTAIEPHGDVVDVLCPGPSGDGPPLAAVVDVHTGTTSLLGALLRAFVGGTS
jgi:hypothetical protein